MKKLLVLSIMTIFLSTLFAQDVKESDTKMELFASRTGVIIKFIDYPLPDLYTTSGAVETKIRKLISGGEVRYFYQISKKGKYNNKTASIAHDE